MEAVIPKMRLKGWVSKGMEEGKMSQVRGGRCEAFSGEKKSRYVRSAENEEEDEIRCKG